MNVMMDPRVLQKTLHLTEWLLVVTASFASRKYLGSYLICGYSEISLTHKFTHFTGPVSIPAFATDFGNPGSLIKSEERVKNARTSAFCFETRSLLIPRSERSCLISTPI